MTFLADLFHAQFNVLSKIHLLLFETQVARSTISFIVQMVACNLGAECH